VIVYFNFPNLAAARADLEAIPQVGHLVDPGMIRQDMFEDEKDYLKFEHWEYSKFTFKISRVVWSPAATTFVNIYLERIP
jgi:hypothetical protein